MSSSCLISNEYKNRVQYNRAKILNAKIDKLNVNELTVNNLNENNDNNNLNIPFVFEKLRILNGTIKNNEISFNVSDLVLIIWSDRSLNPGKKTSYNEKYVGEDAFYYLQLGFNTQFLGNYSFSMNNPNVNITIEDEDYFMILNDYSRENDIITLYFTSQNFNLPNKNFNKIFVNIDSVPLSYYYVDKNYISNDIRRFTSSDNKVLLIHRSDKTLPINRDQGFINITFYNPVSSVDFETFINVRVFIDDNEFHISLQTISLDKIKSLNITGVNIVFSNYYTFRIIRNETNKDFYFRASNGRFNVLILYKYNRIPDRYNTYKTLSINSNRFEEVHIQFESETKNYFIVSPDIFNYLNEKFITITNHYLNLKTNFNEILQDVNEIMQNLVIIKIKSK